jgi:hypothetical protein
LQLGREPPYAELAEALLPSSDAGGTDSPPPRPRVYLGKRGWGTCFATQAPVSQASRRVLSGEEEGEEMAVAAEHDKPPPAPAPEHPVDQAGAEADDDDNGGDTEKEEEEEELSLSLVDITEEPVGEASRAEEAGPPIPPEPAAIASFAELPGPLLIVVGGALVSKRRQVFEKRLGALGLPRATQV